MDTDLELVRKGYDPAQVQDLVGKLSSELKGLAAENDRLRAQVAAMQQTASPPSAASEHPDVFAHWSRETDALLDAARESIAKVHAQAETEAAEVVAASEVTAAEVRQQAQLDAELVMSEAQREAEQTLTEARLYAEKAVAEADAHKLATETDARALLEQTNAQVAEAKAQLAGLVQQRSAISQQLGSAKSQLTQLLSLVETDETAPADVATAPAADEPTASAERADDDA